MNALWRDGKHKHQLKMKLIMDLDLEIIGFNEGAKGTKFEGTLGSLIVSTSDRKIISSCGGLKEKSGIRDEIWNNQDKYLGKIASIKCNGISSNKQGGYGLLYPSYNEIRYDKFDADSFDECMKIQEMKCQLQ
jgi:DNA ligase-1